MDNTRTYSIEQIEQAAVNNEVARDAFTYNLVFENLLAGQSQTKSFNIQADSAFMVHNQTQMTVQAAGGQTESTRVLPVVNIMVIDTGTGRQLYSAAVPVISQFGTAELPYILPRPKFFMSRATVSVEVTNVSNVVYQRLELQWNGEKIYFKGM